VGVEGYQGIVARQMQEFKRQQKERSEPVRGEAEESP
jgi:hypothetical protein